SSLYCLVAPHPPPSPPFPYTTLFRSVRDDDRPADAADARELGVRQIELAHVPDREPAPDDVERLARERERTEIACREHRLIGRRSEEHTSELQSRENLVCRLLLEKKK